MEKEGRDDTSSLYLLWFATWHHHLLNSSSIDCPRSYLGRQRLCRQIVCEQTICVWTKYLAGNIQTGRQATSFLTYTCLACLLVQVLQYWFEASPLSMHHCRRLATSRPWWDITMYHQTGNKFAISTVFLLTTTVGLWIWKDWCRVINYWQISVSGHWEPAHCPQVHRCPRHCSH